MKTVIYFLRHCEPDTLARDDLLQPLTPKGMHDAVEAAGFLEGRGICAIWSSDALRAIQTVQAFAQLSGLGIRRDARLREGVLGCAPEENPVYSRAQWADPLFSLPLGESLDHVRSRMRDVTQKILSVHRGGTVLACTHCTALCALISSFEPSFGWEVARTRKRVWPWIVQMDFDQEDRYLEFREIYPSSVRTGQALF